MLVPGGHSKRLEPRFGLAQYCYSMNCARIVERTWVRNVTKYPESKAPAGSPALPQEGDPTARHALDFRSAGTRTVQRLHNNLRLNKRSLP